VEDYIKKETKDKARQEKASKDSIIGRLVEEVIIYLLNTFFEENKMNFTITNDKSHNNSIKKLVDLLCIKKQNTDYSKKFDSDVIVYNNQNFNITNRVFVLSIKGTTRERIGQFLSHLFLMDQNVLNAKYGKDRYVAIFEKEKIKLKYAFITLDWAENKDFIKNTKSGKRRESVKEMEV
jgi:hypothetical protein